MHCSKKYHSLMYKMSKFYHCYYQNLIIEFNHLRKQNQTFVVDWNQIFHMAIYEILYWSDYDTYLTTYVFHLRFWDDQLEKSKGNSIHTILSRARC